MMRALTAGVGLMVASGAALGQSDGRFIIMVSGGATPSSPEVTVEVWAGWDEPHPGDFFFAEANYDLVAGDGEFTSAQLRGGLLPPSSPGTPSGSRVSGASIGNAFCIPGPPWPGIKDNPIALASYTWTTTDFTAREVELTTENVTRFRVVPGPGGSCVSLLKGLDPGSASISVTPAPASLAVAGLALVAAQRRRGRPGALAEGASR